MISKLFSTFFLIPVVFQGFPKFVFFLDSFYRVDLVLVIIIFFSSVFCS